MAGTRKIAAILVADIVVQPSCRRRRAAHAGAAQGAVLRSDRPNHLLSARIVEASPEQEAALSWTPLFEPGYPDAAGVDAIETLILPRVHDLGDFEVRRALPAPQRHMSSWTCHEKNDITYFHGHNNCEKAGFVAINVTKGPMRFAHNVGEIR